MADKNYFSSSAGLKVGDSLADALSFMPGNVETMHEAQDGRAVMSGGAAFIAVETQRPVK